jgi:serine/threonine protein kinase
VRECGIKVVDGVTNGLRADDPPSIGPYRLLGRLGAGGMGQVYLAKSPGGWLVAVKVIRPDLAEEPGFRVRFTREIAAAMNVSGMYTAPVVDSDPRASRPWMATAYVPGPSLSAAVRDGGPLPLRSVLTLAAGLAEALGAIHRVGVIHRDLKPSNVLLATDGPRVIDFGISQAAERTALTESGAVMGSPGFMSPEQATGRGQVGAASDVFSLGAVLTFAATADGPFGGGTIPALLYRVVNEEPDLTRVPARLRPLIEKCLAKSPAGRPAPADLLAMLSDDVGVLTGGWLPKTVADTLVRYAPADTAPPPLTSPAEPVSGPAVTDQASQADEAPDFTSDTASTEGVAVASDTRTSAVPAQPGPLTLARRWRRPAGAVVATAVVIAVAVAAIVAFAPGGTRQRIPPAPSVTHVATRSAPTPAPTTPRPPTSSATRKPKAKSTTRAHPSAPPDYQAQPTQAATSSCGSCSVFGGGPTTSSPTPTGGGGNGNGGDGGGGGPVFGGGF